MIETVRKLVAGVLDKEPNEIGLDDSFDELGLDSLDVIQLDTLFEDAIGKKIPDDVLVELTTVRIAAKYLEAA